MLIVKVIAILFREESFSLKTHVLFSCVNATPAGFMVCVKINFWKDVFEMNPLALGSTLSFKHSNK